MRQVFLLHTVLLTPVVHRFLSIRFPFNGWKSCHSDGAYRKGNIWLENTSQQIAFNHLGYSTADRNVLAMTPKGIELINTPVYKAEQNREKQILKISLNEDNTLQE
jgi:uncharacterized protein YycO